MELVTFLMTCLLVTTILLVFSKRRRNTGNQRSPPSLPYLPLVGSLPFITGLNNLPKFFFDKSKQLGPVFTFKMKTGRRFCLILNSREVITEALLKNNYAYSGREAFFPEIYKANRNHKGLAAMNFSETFKKFHKLSLSIMKEFGFGDKQIMETRIAKEVEALNTFIRANQKEAFDPKEIITQATSNIVLNIVLGYRDDYENGIGELASAAQKLADSVHSALDIAPFLRFLPYFKQKFDVYCDSSKRMVEILDSRLRKITTDGTIDSFATRYLEKEGPEYDREQLLFTMRDFVLGGTTTSSGVIRWAMVLLANHPEIQHRLHDEIDHEIPRGRLPSLSDKTKVPYCEATILEIMRLRTILPFSVPRLTLKESVIGGYFIPAETVVIPNLYAVHMNSEEWSDPEAFKPERFLNDTGVVIDKEKVIPFSIGRRSCIGEDLARQELFLFVVGLLQNFQILPPEGQRWIDDKASSGAVAEPKPFKIRMIPRN